MPCRRGIANGANQGAPFREWPVASPVGPASLRASPLLEGVGARSSFGLADFAVFGQARKAVGDGTGGAAAEAFGNGGGGLRVLLSIGLQVVEAEGSSWHGRSRFSLAVMGSVPLAVEAGEQHLAGVLGPLVERPGPFLFFALQVHGGRAVENTYGFVPQAGEQFRQIVGLHRQLDLGALVLGLPADVG